MAVVVGFGLLGFNLMPMSEHGADPRNIRALFHVGATGGLTDEQLLARFVDSERDTGELAFAELVARHGPMVLRVCRMILRNAHDAEDAFQATFLVLARQSRSIRERGSAASWLHGVARRVALSARSAAARRRAHERRAAEMPMPSADDAGWNDFGDVLHQEIEQLPEKYRKAIVLCELEGLTEGQAAQRLEWPVGTVRTRLRRGRERLRGRLLRRGVAPTAVLLGAVGSSEAASISVPAVLARSTIEAVVQPATTKTVPAAVSALTAAVCRAMFLTKLTISLVALLAVGTASLMAVQTLTFTRAKLKPIGSATGTTSARVPAEPAVPIASSPPNLQVSPPTVEILAKLQEPLDMVFPRETPLDDVLKYITRATKYGDRPSDPGIPIYVDPFGLQEAKKSLTVDGNNQRDRSPAEGDASSSPRSTGLGLPRWGRCALHQLVQQDRRGADQEGRLDLGWLAEDGAGSDKARRADSDLVPRRDAVQRGPEVHQEGDHDAELPRHPHLRRSRGPPGGGSLAQVDRQDRPRRRPLEDIPPPRC